MPQKEGVLRAFGPEVDGVGEGGHGLPMAAYEGAAKVDLLAVVLLRVEEGDLANVIPGWWVVVSAEGGRRKGGGKTHDTA